MSSKSLGRLGLAFWPGTPAKDTLRVARLADQVGLDSVWVTESTLAPGRDAISLMGAVAATTFKVRVASGIINIFTRTPTLIASTAATLDELSNGRLLLGLGTGHRDPITNQHGPKFEKPLTRMREYVEVTRRLLEGETVHYYGDSVKLKGSKLNVPGPHRVPIYIAAIGPKMAQLAGTIADGILITLNTVKQLRAMVGHATRAASASKRTIDSAAYVLSCITENREAGYHAARRVLANYAQGAFYHKVFAGAGYEKEVEDIKRLWSEGDKDSAAAAIPDRMVRDFAAVGLHETLQAVTEYRNSGVDLPIISLVYTEDFEQSVARLFREFRSGPEASRVFHELAP